MSSTDWKSIAEFVGIAAIVGSLIFVGLQMRQDQNVAISQIYQSVLDAEVDIHIAMAEHAETLVKARNMQELSETEVQVIEELIEMWVARAFFETMSASRIDDDGWSGPINTFTVMLYNNPGVQQLWSEKMLRKERIYKQFNQGKDFLRFNSRVRDKLAELQDLEK